MQNLDNFFSDINPEFQNKSTKDEQLYGVDAINNSLRNIILISVGERYRFPAFSSLVEDYIGDVQAPMIEQRLLRHIISIVNRWENRVQINVDRSRIQRVQKDSTWKIFIVYSIVNSQVTGTFEETISVRS